MMIGLAKVYAASAATPLTSIQGAVIEIVLIGIVATLATDLWQKLLQLTAGFPAANWGLIGRWVAGFPRGVFVHRPITATPPVRGELALGWAFHYVVGIAYAALYLAVVRVGLASEPSLISAVAFAIVLLVAPWLVMQPALGLGFMTSRTPKPAAVRLMNVSVHATFGIGLYLGAVIWLAAAAS